MDELFHSVSALRKRIETHGPSLRANEALTRYSLINPLLIALGWDLSDPAQVVPEFTIPSNKNKAADYALFRPGDRVPYIIVEAKKLGEGLSEAAHQAITYCTVDGYEYFAVTDGQVWELYRTRGFGGLSNKRVAKFDLLGDSPINVCLKALAFWRSAVSAGVIDEGLAPILGTGSSDEGESSSSTKESRGVSFDDEEPPRPSIPQASSQVWIPLLDLRPKAGEKPRELKLPSGEIVPTTSGWKSLMVESVRWLLSSGKLSGAGDPIQSGSRYIIAPTPSHPNGKPFRAPRQVGSVFVETHHSGASIVRLTLKVIADGGESAANFGVRMQPSESRPA